MIAYIAISFNNRKKMEEAITAITAALNRCSIRPFLFTDQYNFTAEQEKQMMQQAMADIDNCDLLIAETSEKAIGIGIEAGYAKAKGKPVIYLRHHLAEHSTTLAGISDFQVIYHHGPGLQAQLTALLPEIIKKICTAPAAGS